MMELYSELKPLFTDPVHETYDTSDELKYECNMIFKRCRERAFDDVNTTNPVLIRFDASPIAG